MTILLLSGNSLFRKLIKGIVVSGTEFSILNRIFQNVQSSDFHKGKLTKSDQSRERGISGDYVNGE